VNYEKRDEVCLNINNFWLPKGLSHKFLGPYAGPFKVLEKKFPNTYKLELSENLKVHLVFHVLFLKLVIRDASRPDRKHNSRPPPKLVHNEPEFEVDAPPSSLLYPKNVQLCLKAKVIGTWCSS
jgi:hypothetical protein